MSVYSQPYPPPQNFSLFSSEEFAFSKDHDYNVTECFHFDQTRDTEMGIYVGDKNVYSSYIGCPKTNVWNAFYGSGEDEVSQYREELCLAAIKAVEEQMGPFIGLCD
ncbi:hypothetical protein FOZ62_005043, partial [Perkinsus olseni]